MLKEIDTRNFGMTRDNDFNRSRLSYAASSASAKLTGTHTVNPVGINSLTGSPNALRSENAPASTDSFIEQALEHVKTVSDALGFEPQDPVEFVPDSHVEKTSAKAHVVTLYQQYRGIPIFDMERKVRFSPKGLLDDVVGNNVSLPKNINITPAITAEKAVQIAAKFIADPKNLDESKTKDQFGEPVEPVHIDLTGYTPEVMAVFPMPNQPVVFDKGPFGGTIPAHLVIFYRGDDALLGWRILITMPDLAAQYLFIISADKDKDPGKILYIKNTTSYLKGQGNVFEHSPGRLPKKIVPFPRSAEDYNIPLPSPIPDFPDWLDKNETIGNNVIATSGDPNQTLKGQSVGGLISFDPTNDQGDDHKILNIFYFCNYMHDFLLLLGFDEASRNFQKVNISGSGLPGDPVKAFAHKGTVPGTANMSTPPDGRSPIMNMGLVASTNRHTAFDFDVVAHEYCHGLSNHLVGGKINNNPLLDPQSSGMGEGWSDYFALTIQNFGKATERVVTGDWVVNRPAGIRKFPYDSNFPDNFGDLGKGRYDEEHNIGEIWCATLMEMNRKIGSELGSADRGTQLGWQLVVDGMKLTQANPSFLDARDGILKALDDQLTAGFLTQIDYQKARKSIWTAFAKFGMGPDANCMGASIDGIVPDFNLPAGL